ncbi:hypothetical protein BDV93DRAFT_608898 [Ceratobasidium sp. AG-I]|nr:hypothetical protein BDV93DRAFT_608898 [Ceratobasidium sp. AG-I]
MNESCSDNKPDYCLHIVSNPDISGLGVRVAIYVQTLLSMGVASLMPYNDKAFRETSRNSYVVSGGLIIAAIIAWSRDELSLFDGLIVSMLTTIMTAFVTVNASYIRRLGLAVNISSFLFTAFWCYWGLQIWSNPATFSHRSNGPGCNATSSTQFVVVGKSISPTHPGIRGFAIFVFAAGALAALSALRSSLYWLIVYVSGKASEAKYQAAREAAKKQWEWRKSGGSFGERIMTPFGGLTAMIYMIVTTEQMASRNMEATAKGWSFSQTIALVMLGQQLMDCASYFKEEIKARKESARPPRAASP